MNCPLKNSTVLITRPNPELLTGKLAELGAKTLIHPVIRIEGLNDWMTPDWIETVLTPSDWIVFVSANGVRYFFNELDRHVKRERLSCRFAAIGVQTARFMADFGARADLIPARQDSTGLAEALMATAPGDSFLLVRGNRGSDVMAERLRSARVHFREIVVYRSEDIAVSEPQVLSLLQQGEIDWLTVTSSAIAAASVNLWGAHLRKTQIASISPTTSRKLIELGYPPTVEAAKYDIDGLIEAMTGSQ